MCTSPMRIFYTGLKTDSGKDKLVFDSHYPCPPIMELGRAEKLIHCHIPFDPSLMTLIGDHWFLNKTKLIPCGKCDQCRISAAKKWAYRVLMEIGPNTEAWFVTLTFSDEFLPEKVSRKDVTIFMKRLRTALDQIGIRFFACGEYGEQGASHRPHYHFILWNLHLDDLSPDFVPGAFVSRTISRIWPYGRHNIEPVTVRSIAYVARYTSKKTSARRGFIAMSTHPGIGRAYIESHQDALSCDYYPLMVDGVLQRVNPPRYVEKVLPHIDWTAKKDLRVWNAERSQRLLGWIHGVSGERLDNYLRDLYAAKGAKLAKKGI